MQKLSIIDQHFSSQQTTGQPSLLKVTIANKVALIEMNPPTKLIFMSKALAGQIQSELESIEQNPDVNVIILTGKDGSFCTGADIKELADTDFAGFLQDDFIERIWLRILPKCNKPIIAAVNGMAFGGGFEVALACDIVLASEDAQFGLPEIKLGLIPGAGGTQRLAKVAGKARTMQMVLSGRPISAQEALQYHIITQICPKDKLLEEAMKLAVAISAHSQLALNAGKKAVATSFETSLDAGLKYERALFTGLLGTADKREGVAAFAGRRPSKIHSGSIIIVRPLLPNESQETNDGYDYKFLIMKRSPKIIWGGFYAFSGGKVEEQDFYDNWLNQYPEMFTSLGRAFYDFNARICAIRETFEEINVLIARPIDGEKTDAYHGLRDEYEKKYKCNFIQFCKDKSGLEIVPGIDNQFYLYFNKNDENVKKVDINKGEFTNARWLNPKDALQKFYMEELPLIFPQYACICHFTLIKTISEFEKLAKTVYDSNLISYSSMSLSRKNLSKLPQKMREKAVQQFNNEHDLKADSERKLIVFNNTNPKYKEIVKKLESAKNDYKELAEACQDLLVGTMPGDFYDMNDGFPILSKKSSRRRAYWTQNWEIIRFEISEDIFDMFIKHHIEMPKL
ncbi:enoyl-hydratase [Stylonychia lemnae]|uniref:Enoyl-hydratase n=1 Tax=Stylonychia lemnae TaxID=5949 RepID=A0A078B2W1_STYLE|nr:enoyl-hydratase [Stylonychia lemnae]|eukprot:CDW87562.1 enoyl-hydratase [Stylonychia lemnae]